MPALAGRHHAAVERAREPIVAVRGGETDRQEWGDGHRREVTDPAEHPEVGERHVVEVERPVDVPLPTVQPESDRGVGHQAAADEVPVPVHEHAGYPGPVDRVAGDLAVVPEQHHTVGEEAGQLAPLDLEA
jgi:hypothetical protein